VAQAARPAESRAISTLFAVEMLENSRDDSRLSKLHSLRHGFAFERSRCLTSSPPLCNAYTIEALSREPILIYEQAADDEARYVYYGETERNRLPAIVLTERDNKIRVITAYGLDAGQKRDYLERRARGE